MRARTIVVMLMAILCGSSAAVGVNALMGASDTEPKKEIKTTSIIVAAMDIPRGTALKPELLKAQPWPDDLLPAGSLQEMDQVVGRATLSPFVVGEPVLESRLAESGVGGAAALVKPGMRAYTIATPTTSAGVAGMIQPGNRVDVLLTVERQTFNIAGGGGTWILLQNVEILAADQRLDQQDESAANGRLQSVTLHVTPDMATKLTLAQTMGTLNLTLRNDTDKTVADSRPFTMNDLQFLQDAFVVGEAEASKDATDETNNAIARADDAPRDILTLRGSTAAVVRVSPSPSTRRQVRVAQDSKE